MNKRNIIIIGLVICFIMSISAVSAADNDYNATDSLNNQILTSNQDSDYGVSDDENVLNAVSSPQDSDILRAGEGTFSDLQGKINSASSGDTIILDTNYTFNRDTDSDLVTGVVVSKDITIDGQGKITLDAKNQARIFRIIDGRNIVITGITFVNGNMKDYEDGYNGGAISRGTTDGGSFKISGCNFINNTANYGGAIYVLDSVEITDCTFTDCTATDNGGSILSRAPIPYVVMNNITITNSHADGEGGAIELMYDIGSGSNRINVFLSNMNFINCTADGDGGAMMVDGPDAKLRNITIRDCIAQNGGGIYFREPCNDMDNISFIHNHAFEDGGAAYYYPLYGTTIVSGKGLTNSILINNTADNDGGALYLFGNHGAMGNVTIINNTASEHGGAIVIKGSDWTISVSVFINNTAINNHGGAIYLEDSIGSTIDLCNFTDNHAGLNGGAIDWHAGATDGKLTNSIFINNTAKRSGGAVYWSGTNGVIENSVFTDNYALGQITDNIGGGDGAAVLWIGHDGIIKGSNFTHNNATYRGGAIFLKGSDNVTIDWCKFNDNWAGSNGGAVDFQEGATNGRIFNSTFTNNTAMRSAGAVYWFGTYGTIRDSNFTDNRATASASFVDDPRGFDTGYTTKGGNGGAIVWAGSHALVDNCNFVNNTAAVRGGAVYLQRNDNSTFSNSHFIRNTAGTNGGALDWFEGALNGRVINDTFDENTAKRSGGAIYWYGDGGIILNSNFTNNCALGIANATNPLGVSTVGGDGGAIIWTGSNGLISNTIFENNTAKYRGGAIFLQKSSLDDYCENTTVSKSTFINNIAGTNGGAIDWFQGAHDGLIDQSEFINNTAKRSGGAVYWSGDYGNITNSNFTNNRALGIVNTDDRGPSVVNYTTLGGNGGAIIWTGNYGFVDNCRFINNSAPVRGGAVYLQRNQNATFQNSLFENNSAGTNGGAIDWYKGAENGLVLNSTFNNNVANRSGGAIYWFGDNGFIINSNFTNNIAKGIKEAEDPFGVVSAGGDGGAIIWTGNNGNVVDCRFEDNIADKRGGAVYLQSAADVSSTNTSFDKCYFKNNIAGTNGGAIDWHEGADQGSINRSQFIANIAGSNGGAIFWNGHHGNITYSNFTNNRAKGDLSDGRNQGDGGAIIWSGLYGNVDHCIFINNTADKRGGAVYLQNCTHGHCNDTKFTYCHFENNTAGTNGGALDWYEGATNGLVAYSNFINNVANRSGGAIYWNGEHGTVYKSNFTDNKALGIVKTQAFGEQYAGGDGGAVIWTGNDGNITECRFIGNEAFYDAVTKSGGRGGAIFLRNNVYGVFAHDYFENNTAGSNGGAVDWFEGAHDGYVEYCEFVNNTAKRSGGAIYWNGQNGTIYKSNFTGNNATGEVQYEAFDEIAGGDGGAVIWTGDKGNVEGCIFINNTALHRGGAVFLRNNTDGRFSNDWFENNTAGTNGGAVDWYEGAENGLIDNSTFINNTATNEGGAIFWNGHNGTIKNSYFNDNNAIGESSYGGAVCWTGSDGLIQNTTFYNNTAKLNGGALNFRDNVNGTVYNCTFEFNIAEQNGGAIFWRDGAANGNVTDSIFINNTAKLNAGAIEWQGPNGTVDNCIFEDNKALGSNGRGHGGAVVWFGDDGIINRSSFNHDQSNEEGSAIYIRGSDLKIYYSNFTNHLSNKSGTIYVNGKTTDIDYCIFDNNTVAEAGGAIYWVSDSSNDEIAHSNFTNNKALSSSGGAIFWGSNANNGTILGSYFENNTADGTAGAVYWGSSSDGAIINSIFKSNYATGNGGALYWNGVDGSLINTSFINNHADGEKFVSHPNYSGGGAVIWSATNGLFDNCTFENNTSPNHGGAIYGKDSSNLIVNNSRFIGNKVTSNGGTGGVLYVESGNYIVFLNSNFTNNFAKAQAGVIYYNLGCDYSNLTNCIFDGNNARQAGAVQWDVKHGVIDNCTFKNNYISQPGSSGADNHAAALIFAGDDNLLINSRFENNIINETALGSTNEAFGTVFYTATNSKISHCNFTNNSAPLGGGICVVAPNAIIEDLICINNSASDGGAIVVKFKNSVPNNVIIANSTFIGNKASSNGGAVRWDAGVNGKLYNSVFEDNSAYEGGAVSWGTAQGHLYDCNFTNNSVYNTIKGLWARGGTILWNGQYGLVNNIIINGSENKNRYAGAICWTGSDGRLENATIINSTTASNGGAIYIGDKNSNVNITHVNIINSKAIENGGAIYSDAVNVIINDVNITNSSANKLGGSVYINKLTSLNNVNINNTISENIAGAIYANNIVNMENITINNSTAKNGAGAVYINSNSNNDVINNVMISNSKTLAGQGGAFYIVGPNAKLYNITVNNASAKGNGGAIYGTSSNVDLILINISDSHAENGGGIYWTGSNTKLEDATITDSSAANNGGAIYWSGSNPSFKNITLSENKAKYGGAVYWDSESSLANIELYNNTAVNGGAVYWNTRGTSIVNATMKYNKAEYGSAIYFNSPSNIGSGDIINVTLLDNQARAIKFTDVKITITDNSIDLSAVLEGGDNLLNAIYNAKGIMYFTNVTYWDENGITNTGSTRVKPNSSNPKSGDTGLYQTQHEAGQNVTFTLYGSNNGEIFNQTKVTDHAGNVTFSWTGENAKNLAIRISHFEDNYYTQISQATKNLSVVLIDVVDIIYGQSEPANVTVIAYDSNIKLIPSGNISVYIDDELYNNYTLNADGKYALNIPGLHVGTHKIRVEYHGDDYFLSEFNEKTFIVKPIDSQLLINITDYYYGNIGKANITVPEYVTGIVNITIAGQNYTIDVTENKTVEIEFPILNVGNYTIYASYPDYGDYKGVSTSKDFQVLKVNSTITISVSYAKLTTITVTVGNYNITGNITLIIDGESENIILDANGQAFKYITNMPTGLHEINATYYGDYNHYGSYNETLYEAVKYLTPIDIDAHNLTYGETQDIIITVPTDIDGQNLTVTYNGESKNYTVQNGQVIIPSDLLPVGKYSIEVSFDGTDDYDQNRTLNTFWVNPATPVMDAVVENITYNVTEEHIAVYIEQTGNVTIRITDANNNSGFIENPEIIIENGQISWNISNLAGGSYIAEFTFNGNQNYSSLSINKIFEVSRAPTNLTINITNARVGETTIFNITVNSTKVTGNVTVIFDGDEFELELVNGTASFVKDDLIYGNHSIVAIYGGDRNYSGSRNSTKFTIDYSDKGFFIISAQNITVGENETIKVIVPEDAKGLVLIDVNGIGYYINLTKGERNITIPYFDKGEYEVNGTWILDPKYGTLENKTLFTVGKVNSTIGLELKNITYGETEVINVTLPHDATGNITLYINDVFYANLTVNNGNATISLILPAGTYKVNVTYDGDRKYNGNKTSGIFTVNQTSTIDMSITVQNITYTQKEIITVYINATGNVTLKLNGETEIDQKPIIDGKVEFIIENLPANNYTAEAIYNGNANYSSKNTTANFTVSKIDPKITIEVQNITYGMVEHIIVHVNASGNVNITVNGNTTTIDLNNGEKTWMLKAVSKPVIVEYDGKATLNIYNLPVGVYPVNVLYLGNDNYNQKEANAVFTVSQIAPDLDVEVSDIQVWDKEIINITVHKNATGEVLVYIDANTTPIHAQIINGTAQVNLTGLDKGIHSIWVFYDGDKNFAAERMMKTFNVDLRTPVISVNATNITVGQSEQINITIPANATGYVVITGNCTDHPIYIDKFIKGNATIILNDLAEGNYTVSVKYYGDGNYTAAETETVFTVSKINTVINISVESIDYGQKANITVNVASDAGGFITIRINETRNITLPVINGKVNWIVDGLAADNYTVYADYSGNTQYNINSTEKSFEVKQISPEIRIISVISDAGKNATVIVEIDSRITENITIHLDKDYSVKAVNGRIVLTTDILDYDTYTITAIYSGDKNFTYDEATLSFTTNKTSDYQINVTAHDIYVGNYTNITVNLPEDVQGTVKISLNGTNYTVTVNDGVANLTNISTLDEGVYDVIVYFGNDKYANKTAQTRFAVSKTKTPITITVDPVIYVGDKAVITVNVNNDVENNLTIEIDGVKYNKTVDSTGKVLFEIVNLTAGNKTVTATYIGDKKYLFNSTTANFTVSKRQSQLNVTAVGGKVGENAIVTVQLPQNATGYVIVNVNGINYTINITNKNYNVEIPNLENGTYNVYATYLGDNQYDCAVNNTAVFTIDKIQPAITIEGQDITFGENELLIIESPENITGIVKVEINGKNHTGVIYNGKGNITISNISVGDYNVTVYFEGDNKFLATSAKGNFTVRPSTRDIIIVPQNITFGEKETITIYINATGKLNITVDNVEYNDKDIVDGKVILEVPGYLYANNYTVTVSYGGNENYTVSSANANFTVAKAEPIINIEVQNITYGDVEHIKVHVNAEGNVTITAAGNSTIIILGQEAVWILMASIDEIVPFDGQATWNIHNLPAGVYPVEAIFNGNENYNKATFKTFFVVEKQNITVSVDVENIRVDGKEVINITVSNTNVTGDVIINVDGVNYTRTLTDGKANITLDKLSNKTYSVVVIYEGDTNFNANWTSATFNVTKVKPVLTIDVLNRTVGDSEKIIIHLPENATGYVVINVDETKYHVDIIEGEEISLEITDLKNKTYKVFAEYSGDEYYESSDNFTSFNVGKMNSTVTVKVENITVGDVATVNITVTTDATGNITIKIGDEYEKTFGITDGTISIIVPGLTAGEKTVDVTYNGDDKYLSNKNSTKFTVGKINATGNIKVIDQGNGTVIVIVPENATGNVTVKLGNNTYNATVVNGTAVVNLTNATPGEHNITVIYSGDENHTNSTVNATINIPKLAPGIKITVENIYVGDKERINVTLPEDATGNVTVEIDGKLYKPVEFNNGNAKFIIENLTYGNKTAAVIYSGDANYTDAFATANFTVEKRTPTIKIETEDIKVGQITLIKVTVPENATGYVIIDINNQTYAAKLENGVGTVEVKILTNGTLEINATYLGDNQYYSSNNQSTIKVSKVPSTLIVTAENITVGDKEVIELTLPTDLCGNVTVTVNNTNYTVYVSGGHGILVIPDLKVGNYTVNAIFDGCNKYEANHNSTTFTVGKINATVDINVIDQGNGTVVVIVPGNATGNVTVKVGNNTYNATVVNGTGIVNLVNESAGTHNITVIYEDENITAVLNTTITIAKLDTPIKIDVKDIYVGDTVKITVTVPINTNENVTIEIDGVKYTNSTVGGNATFYISGLTAGNKTVVVTYPGDVNYTFNSTTAKFTVLKRTSSVTSEDVIITAGETKEIEINVPQNATGWIIVEIGNDTYAVKVTEGKGLLNITPKTSSSMNITYLGDDQYLSSNNNYAVTVNKVPSTVSVSVDNITVGDKAIINIGIDKDATGNVTVTVDGKEYDVVVAGGKAILVVSGLKADEYTVDVVYHGDYKYNINTNSTKFKVSKLNITDDVVVEDKGNGTVIIYVPGNATGNVTVKVGNDTYNVTVINGTAIVNMTNTTPGTYNVTVIYSGDENHTNVTVNSTVTIPKHVTPIKTVTTDISVGDTAVIIVKVPEDATGDVTIEIEGKTYTQHIVEGVARFEIENLTYGTKTIAVNYIGDDNYTGNHTTANITVNKVKSSVNATIEDKNVGESVTVKITVPTDATGYVLIDIDGVGYYVNITKGTGSVEIPRIPSGEYNVNVTYLGDDKYLPSNNTAEFKVSKLTPFVIPIAQDIHVGDNEVIRILVPSDATGNVTMVISGEEYTFSLNDGIMRTSYDEGDKYIVAISGGNGEITITGLSEGEYTVSVKYNGDGKYSQISNTTTFTVSRTIQDMHIIDKGNGTIIVELSGNATGNVTVKVGNETYNATVINGTAVVDLTNSTPGEHNITVIYSGDDTYDKNVKNTTIIIPKYNTPISVNVKDIYVGDTAIITVNVPDKAKGKLSIEINGKTYTSEVKNGKAVFNVLGLSFGDKTVAVKYFDDDDYVDNFTTAKFKVYKRPSTVTAKGKNIKVGTDEIITVNVPGGATGRVLVDIKGVGYYAQVINGVAKVIVPELPSGTYNAKVTYEGDDKYLPSTTSITFKVTKSKTPMKASGDEIDVGEDGKVTVKVPSDATGTVTITVNGKTYTSEVKNGKATFKVPGLTKGDYNVNAKYSGNKKYSENSTITDILVHGHSDHDEYHASGHVNAGLAKHATGNPILVLLVILFALVGCQIRRFKK